MNEIIKKADDIDVVGFRTIDDKALAEINSWMPEVSRATGCFSKTNSQTTASLMTLTMLEAGPYRVLRQVLAQANNKKAALKEVLYNQSLKQLDYEEMLNEMRGIEKDSIDFRRLGIKTAKIKMDIDDSISVIENCIKEIGAYKDRYFEIMKNNNIPDNWDEEDFEAAEIEHHIKCIFRNAVRDKLQGSCNMGTMEYMEQFGINPITAYALVDNYINSTREVLANGKGPDINAHYSFFDSMYGLFKDEYKKAMRRIGLDSITQPEFLMKENK